MTTPILEIENLNGSFPSKQVLHNINLTLQPGRKLALVGESGSGKTVLSQGIMRLNPMVTFEGRLKYCGTDLLTQPERALQKLRGRENRHGVSRTHDRPQPRYACRRTNRRSPDPAFGFG